MKWLVYITILAFIFALSFSVCLSFLIFLKFVVAKQHIGVLLKRHVTVFNRFRFSILITKKIVYSFTFRHSSNYTPQCIDSLGCSYHANPSDLATGVHLNQNFAFKPIIISCDYLWHIQAVIFTKPRHCLPRHITLLQTMSFPVAVSYIQQAHKDPWKWPCFTCLFLFGLFLSILAFSLISVLPWQDTSFLVMC